MEERKPAEELLASLPSTAKKQDSVLILYEAGYTYKEIAEAIGKSVTYVSSSLYQMRKHGHDIEFKQVKRKSTVRYYKDKIKSIDWSNLTLPEGTNLYRLLEDNVDFSSKASVDSTLSKLCDQFIVKQEGRCYLTGAALTRPDVIIDYYDGVFIECEVGKFARYVGGINRLIKLSRIMGSKELVDGR